MATLKISDISVGDWVRCGQWNGRIQRIAMHDGETVEVIIEGDCGSLYMYKQIYEINSIPITPEILEANGFESPRVGIGFDTWFWSNRRDMALELRRYVNDKWQLAYQIKDKVQAHLLFPLYHIHELQHIIRLLHIDKEIVIHKKQ